jgi:hypothetical protein
MHGATIKLKEVSQDREMKQHISKGQQRISTCFVGFEVFTAVVMKSIIFWDMTPCSPSSFNRGFGGTYRLHLHVASCSLVCLTYLFDPEDGGDMFLGNVG